MQRVGRHSERVRDLRRAVRKRPEGRVVVDGRRLVADLIRWGLPLRELYISEELAESGEGVDLCLKAESCWVLAATVLAEIAPTRSPQGLLAVVDEPRVRPWEGDRGIGVFLEGVQDPGNLGAIIRSAAALGAQAVLLAPGCADPFSPAAVRGSAGAVFRLPPQVGAAVAEVASGVRRNGGWVWAASAGGRPLGDWHPRGPGVLLLGAEGAGLRRETMELADGVVTVPLAREVESLNVAVAAGILLHHLRSVRS